MLGKDLVFFYEREGNRLKVYVLDQTYKQMREVIGKALIVPSNGRERFQAILGEVGNVMPVQSDVDVHGGRAEVVDADPRPTVQLRGGGKGLLVRVAVFSLGLSGPSFAPGHGAAAVLSRVEGRTTRGARDLAREEALFEALIRACPSLPPIEEELDQVILPDPISSYELIADFARLLEGEVVVAWPEGEPLTLVAERDVYELTLRFASSSDRLSASGSLALDEEGVLQLAELLKRLDEAKGRFIELGEGKILAFTERLRRRLMELDALGRRKRSTLELSPMALFSIEAWVGEAAQAKGKENITVDHQLKGQLTRLREAETLVPELPSTLRADLRDYQHEGLIWLARLAHWGGGACLADDMGLGKTLQVLTLLLRRVEEGPALVVAPTSVCGGWIAEATRFCPTLRLARYGEGDKEVPRQLRRILRPFILRRTKAQVLTELPPKTAVVLRVIPRADEAAFYEAVRQRAIARVSDVEMDSKQRMRILGELMRLRRAACHPRLVARDSDLRSAKLDTLFELIHKLRDEGHKALVFSQFVDHLTLVREGLDASGLVYQYLDGSTPPKKREAAVAAFQRGEGDLFLISLRAGGVGLNLTAADYVIHLDPWWNPAVEDQASDRAHRIGQERPVTIYKLVTEGTIEERIIDLHGNKRELAAQLLAGSETSTTLSVEQLRELLKSV